MNAEQIKDEVIRYLQDDNYRYAIMIEGEWGCGKTHFVLNDLKHAIEKFENTYKQRKVRYISLYGCKAIEEIEEKICWSILDEAFYKRYDKFIDSRDIHGNKKKRAKMTRKICTSVSRKFINVLMQKFDIPYKDHEFFSDFFAMDSNIFVFDDLERCNCLPNDVLGYINGLVEHEGVKVLLIANEEEIGRLVEVKNKELQYLVAANNNIIVPKKESVFGYGRNSSRNPEFSIEELERRRASIFSEIEYNQQYLRIREKLIGQTLRYETDYVSIIHKLINNGKCNHELKTVLSEHVKYFHDTMEEYRHNNLRTFQFFMSKMEYLYEQLIQLKIEKRYFSETLSFMVENCFMLCIEYKGDIKEPEDEFQRIMFQNKRRMESINEYVKYSSYNIVTLNKDINNYIATEVINHLPDNDPYVQLYDRYYRQTQAWVEDKVKQVLDKLKNNEYQSNIYSRMLVIFVRLVGYGFPKEFLDKAEKYMLKNVKAGNVETVLDDYIASDQPKEITKCKEIIGRINREIIVNRDNSRKNSIKSILTHDMWGKEIYDFWDYNKQNMPYNVQLLSSMEGMEWAKKIIHGSAEDINYFTKFVCQLYPDNVIKQGVRDDMQVIGNIIQELSVQTNTEQDIIKKVQLTWLVKELNQILENYHGNS